MSDVLNVLTRKTSLRKACRDISMAEMEKLAENLSEIIEERKVDEAARLEEQKEKLAKLETLKKEILESGLDLAEIVESLESTGSTGKKKGTVQPKYEIRDSDGELHQWTGRGRTPKVFQQFFDQGGSKEECLIK
ncbi:MAG: H-NS histone family protein [Motiliproteus sp.]|nr:H-NS histone family protein [Motiliproteus sp.]MCW9053471.1 H-NS histone family protein [Motiliproteus sp.]